MPEINTAAHATHAHIREVYERCTRGIYERCTTGEVAWGREARGAQGVWGQGVGVEGTSARITGPTQGLGATAHLEHPLHVRDAGRVERGGQRLVEPLRDLPSREKGMCCWAMCAREAGVPGIVGRRGGAKRFLVSGAYRQGRAHVEHRPHVHDTGHVETDRLVEGRRVLPVRGGASCGPGGGRRRPTAVRAQLAGERARLQIEGAGRSSPETCGACS